MSSDNKFSKAILLAGGSGSRLQPVTSAVNKHLLPVYDRPLIYFPLSLLMLCGIREILLISTQKDIPDFQHLLKDGRHLGISLQYKIQEKPRGLAEAFLIGRSFIGNDNVVLCLGDNIFHDTELDSLLNAALKQNQGATIFSCQISNSSEYGVVQCDARGKPIKIIEKPQKSTPGLAVPGLYFYDNQVVEISENITPSDRGELEISSINQKYLDKNQLSILPFLLEKDSFWLDAGTPESLLEAGIKVKEIEEKQGVKIGCVEEVAYLQGLITKSEFEDIANSFENEYGIYLRHVLDSRTPYPRNI